MLYSRVDQIWDDESNINLVLPNSAWLCRLPTSYLEKSGTNDWQLVLDIARALIEDPIVLVDGDRIIDQMDQTPVAGTYSVRNAADPSKPSLKLRKGPEGKTRFVPLNDLEQSTISASSRSTVRQSGFRVELVARDSMCVVSNARFGKCIASHIVPFSRLDVYERIYQSPLTSDNLFEVSMGVLLRDDLSRSFDRFEWAIYARGRNYYFHAAGIPRHDPDANFHGKLLNVGLKNIIPNWSLRLIPDEALPKPSLCKWHWEQCMQAHVRGFAVWDSEESTSTRVPRASSMENRGDVPKRVTRSSKKHKHKK